MYGDTEQMRRRVDQLRQQGADVRALAEELMARTDALGWTGRAAGAMRERVAERASQLRTAADGHDRAAEALGRHLRAVTDAQDHIAAIEERAAALVADARIRIARIEAANEDAGVRREPDPADVALAGFTPPAPGHRDWLTVELPGL